MSKLDTRVVQVSNISATATKDQLKTLFQFIGRIREIKVFPPDGSDQQVASKVSYVEFDDTTSAGVALHLTNTVFIDRALMVVPVMDGKIPDDRVAMTLTPQTVSRMSQGQPSWPANVVSQLTGTGINQVITTYDPRLNSLGLPQYPPLPANLDAAKVEEIRRTVYIGNLDNETTPDNLIQFFSQAGEVKFVRMAGKEGNRGAYLEFTDQRSVAGCLAYNGVSVANRIITVQHAKTAIVKPLSKSQEASKREVEEAMKKVKEAQSLISAAAGERSRSRSRSRRRSRSRSRSRSRRRSRSRSRGRRRRTRSRTPRRRSRSPRRFRRSRSRSPRRRRSRSRRRRSRSRSPVRRRSRSRSPRKRSRTPPRAYASRRSRSRSRGAARRKSRSRSPRGSSSRKPKDRKDRDEKKKEKKKEKRTSVSRSPSPPLLQREEPCSPRSASDDSPAKLDPSDATSDKKSTKPRERSKTPPRRRKSVSRSPVRSRKRSPSPGRSRRRSPSPRKRRSKSRSPRRSRSPMKKKKARSPRRSRSVSRHRSKKDKKKERSRSRDRKEKDKKKKSSKDKGRGEEKAGKVTRDYDEEEKGFSGSDHERRTSSPPPRQASPPPATYRRDDEDDDRRSSPGEQPPMDMDTSD